MFNKRFNRLPESYHIDKSMRVCSIEFTYFSIAGDNAALATETIWS
jgi:hypothetical protein